MTYENIFNDPLSDLGIEWFAGTKLKASRIIEETDGYAYRQMLEKWK